MTEPTRSSAGPSSRIKAIMLIALTLLFVAGIVRIELWPFTGWRLYATPRGPMSEKHYAYRVGPGGAEHKIDYDRLPYSYGRAPYLLDKFPSFDAAEREAVCDGLAHGEREAGRPVVEIRVYRERRRVVPVNGERHTKLLERALRYTCARDAR